MSNANSRQVGGDHYKQKDGGEEHWDRVARLGLDYFQGQITKYVERWKHKNGVQDLLKAQHFLQKYIELVNKGAYRGCKRVPGGGAEDRAGPTEGTGADVRGAADGAGVLEPADAGAPQPRRDWDDG